MNLEEIFILFYDYRQTWPKYPAWPFEAAFSILVLLLTLILFRSRPHWMIAAEQALSRVAVHRNRCVLAIIFSVIAIRVALLPWMPVPIPSVHDECSYLFQADTFAAGRLTNPPHPMWHYFETFHVNMVPTYQSMYPPAQALFLAFGKVTTGVAWSGVVLSTALMCGAFCWMLQGWIPPQWALLGAIIATLRYGIFSYWMNSYFGGSVAALGGALLVGCLPRLRRRIELRHTLLYAIALVILANSRPLEGLVVSAPLTLVVLWALLRNRQPKLALVRAVAPAVGVLILAGAGMLYYNWRGTGSVTTMPYAANYTQYHITKPFLWQKANPIPHYRHLSMRALYVNHELPNYLTARTEGGLWIVEQQQGMRYYGFFVWPSFILFVLALRFALFDSQLRVVAIAVLALTIVVMLQVWPAQPHYAAPATGAVLLLLMHILRLLHSNQRFHWMPWLSRAFVLVLCCLCVCAIAHRVVAPFGHMPESEYFQMAVDRQRLQTQLERMPGKHLVIVHYRRDDWASNDWIYNAPDIDNAKVVWARDIADADEPLIRYFSDRHVWYVDRGDGLHKLYPYNQSQSQQLDQLAQLPIAGSHR